MIEFTDAGGDPAQTWEHDEGWLIVECTSVEQEGDYVPLALDASMARALAADLVAWADSVDAQEEG